MSEPTRWSREDGGGPRGARELLGAAARPRGMAPRERTDAFVRASRVAATPVAVTASWWASKALAAALALGGAGVVVTAAHAHLTAPRVGAVERRPQRRADPSTVATAPPAQPLAAPALEAPPTVAAVPLRPVAPPMPAPPPSPRVRRAATRPPDAAPTPAPPSPSVATAPAGAAGGAPSLAAPPPEPEALSRETAVLLRAHALLADDPAAALALLDTHATTFPRGGLLAEREFMAVAALRRVGRGDEATARGRALIARLPESAYAERVRRLLAAP